MARFLNRSEHKRSVRILIVDVINYCSPTFDMPIRKVKSILIKLKVIKNLKKERWKLEKFSRISI